MRQRDCGARASHRAPKHLALNVCAKPQLPRLEYQVTPRPVGVKMRLRCVPPKGLQDFLLILYFQEFASEYLRVLYRLFLRYHLR